MASNKVDRFGPVALTTSANNLLSPPTLSGGAGLRGVTANTYVTIRHMRVVNKSNAAATVSLFLGASGGSVAGTEVAFNSTSIPANGNAGNYVDWYGLLRLDVGDYLTGLASANTSLTWEAEGEVGVA